jgi:hypothetical protein
MQLVDAAYARAAAAGTWPSFVEPRVADALTFLAGAAGGYDLDHGSGMVLSTRR